MERRACVFWGWGSAGIFTFYMHRGRVAGGFIGRYGIAPEAVRVGFRIVETALFTAMAVLIPVIRVVGVFYYPEMLNEEVKFNLLVGLGREKRVLFGAGGIYSSLKITTVQFMK